MESGVRDVAVHAVVAVDVVIAEAAAMDQAVDVVVAVDPVSAEDHAVNDVGVGAHLEHPSTPQPKSFPSTTVSSKEHLKPMVEMIFDTLADVEEFY